MAPGGGTASSYQLGGHGDRAVQHRGVQCRQRSHDLHGARRAARDLLRATPGVQRAGGESRVERTAVIAPLRGLGCGRRRGIPQRESFYGRRPAEPPGKPHLAPPTRWCVVALAQLSARPYRDLASRKLASPPFVRLEPVSEADCATLLGWVRAPTAAQRLVTRSRIVLLLAEGRSTREVARLVGVSRPTVVLWRQRFREGGCDALTRDRPGRGRKKASVEKPPKS